MPYPNPAWSNKIWQSVWERIAASHGPEYLPRGSRTKRGVVKAEEYGAGHYGVVSPCGVSGLVVKVTTDPTEAELVACLLGLYKGKEWLPGLVEYKDIVRIPDASHKGRGVWVIWRQEAHHVGYPAWERHLVKDDYTKREVRYFGVHLGEFKKFAHALRLKIKGKPLPPFDFWKWNGEESFEYLGQHTRRIPESPRGSASRYFTTCFTLAKEMSSEVIGQNVGNCLVELMRKGIVLADVHQNNIGMLPESDLNQSNAPCITDPGHAVFLDPSLVGCYVARTL